MKRSVLCAVGWVASVAVLVSGCGTSSETTSAAPSSASVTITQVNGVTEFPVGPTRIVASGYGIDNLLALGVKPTAVIESALPLPAPWHGNKLDGVPIIKVSGTDARAVSTEEIAKYRPDLFVGESYMVDSAVFERLSKITKVLGGVERNGSPMGWDAQLEALGEILGKSDDAQKVIDEDKAKIADVKKKYPELSGRTAIVAQYIAAMSSFNLVSAESDPANKLFSELGMKLPKAVTENPAFKAGKDSPGGRTPVSLESLPTIGANFMAIYPAGAPPQALDTLPGYSGLPQVAGGTTMVCDMTTIMAMNVPSSLSRAWVLDKLYPYFSKVQQQPVVA